MTEHDEDFDHEPEGEEETHLPASISPFRVAERLGESGELDTSEALLRQMGSPAVPSIPGSRELIDRGPLSSSSLLRAARISPAMGSVREVTSETPITVDVKHALGEGSEPHITDSTEKEDSGALHDAFFAGAEPIGSLPPLAVDPGGSRATHQAAEHLDDEDAHFAVLTPEELKRRARFRGVVAAVLGLAAVAAVWVLSAKLSSRSHQLIDSARTDSSASVPQTVVAPSLAKPQDPTLSDVPPEVKGGDPEPLTLSSMSSVPLPAPATLAPGQNAVREARRLLEAGNIVPGVAYARAAIEQDAKSGEGYVLLAAGLQDLGRWKESRAIFGRCVRAAKAEMNEECHYFATH